MTVSIEKLANYVVLVLNLVNRADWTRLEKVVSNQELLKLISVHIQQSDKFNRMTLLHFAVRLNPPVHILDAMIDAHGDVLKGQDCVGRLPLHVACGSGASSQIINRLVKAYPQACDIQDEDGKLPLHFACDTECVLFEDDETPRSPPTIDVVKILLSGSMQSVLVEDEDEMNPIECAVVSGLDIKIVNLLQRASICLRRKQANASNEDPKINREEDKQDDKTLPVLRRSILA